MGSKKVLLFNNQVSINLLSVTIHRLSLRTMTVEVPYNRTTLSGREKQASGSLYVAFNRAHYFQRKRKQNSWKQVMRRRVYPYAHVSRYSDWDQSIQLSRNKPVAHDHVYTKYQEYMKDKCSGNVHVNQLQAWLTRKWYWLHWMWPDYVLAN